MAEVKSGDRVRVRFAPSPTGYLHIGGARTALFNWLFARQNNGTFILRIEDTDTARSTEESTRAILESMRWLGLEWDEGPDVGGPYGPYFQSQRLELYKEYADRLLEDGWCYPCYCTPEELKERRERAIAEGRPPGYDGRCRNLTEGERRQYEKEGRKPVLRFAIPEGETHFHDIVRGDVTFKNEVLDDFIIIKSDGMPTYNFAVVVDDAEMKITHVIRAEDHISNTPRQILLYKALGLPLPVFAHVPLLFGTDRKRLSKRHGATSVGEFAREGYLPEAMINYLALLGWSYDEKQQIFSVSELIEKFDLKKVGKNPAVFDHKKLAWMNGYYIRQLDPDVLTDRSIPYLQEAGLVGDVSPKERERIKRIIGAVYERMRTLSEVTYLTSYFFTADFDFDDKARKYLCKQGTLDYLKLVREELALLERFDEESTETAIRELAARLEVGAGKLIHPTRAAVTGRGATPGLFLVLELIGRDQVLSRLDRTIRLLENGELE